MKPAVFDKVNSHFKSKYASLTSVVDSVREPLSKNGIALVQSISTVGDVTMIITSLIHCSGQWLSDGGFPLILDKQNMQGMGSAVSYAKRFGLSALMSQVADEDDDGEGSIGRPKKEDDRKPVVKPPVVVGIKPPVAGTIETHTVTGVWKRLTEHLKLNDDEARGIIVELTGKQKSADLSPQDLVKLNQWIEFQT